MARPAPGGRTGATPARRQAGLARRRRSSGKIEVFRPQNDTDAAPRSAAHRPNLYALLPFRPIRAVWLFALLAGAVTLSGCGVLWSRHKVARLPQIPLKSATLQQLVAQLDHEATSIHTLDAKVLLMASTGGPRSGTVTEYKDIVAYLLVRKPAYIRLLGQFSIFGTVFDMASNGQTFRLSIPPKNQFFVGHNDVIPEHVKNPLEKLRPQVILDALLINPILPGQQVAAMNDFSVARAQYTMLVLSPGADGVAHVVRKIVFSRYDLEPKEEVVYEANGSVATDVQFGEFVPVEGIPFPAQIVIHRPLDEYSIRMLVQHITFNRPLSPEQFVLRPPAGSKIIHLSANGPAAAAVQGGR